MDTQAGSTLPGWRATCAVAIVAATLLVSCERQSHPTEVHAQANVPASRSRASDVYVHVNEGIVSVRANDAPLHAVIEKLAKHGGLQVSTQDRLDERVTVELQSLTLTAALQELLRDRSFILIGAPQSTATRQDSRTTLRILANGLNGSGAYVSPGSSDESAAPEEPRSLDELSAALTNHDSNARLDAVSELDGHFDDEQSATILASVALSDRDAGVRKAAISALENIGAEHSLQTLALALRDHDASVRATAVDAIGEIGGDVARRLLESALADESAIVREAATEQLDFP